MRQHMTIKEIRAKIFQHWFFSETFTTVRWSVSYDRYVKQMGDHHLERTCPEEHPKSEKIGLR